MSKVLINKETTILTEDGKENIGFAELSVTALFKPVQGGWDPAQQRIIYKIVDKLEKKDLKFDDQIELEDREFEILAQSVRSPWAFMHREVTNLEAHITEIEKVE